MAYETPERLKKQLDFILQADAEKEIERRTLISSGKLLRENLPVAGRTESWVNDFLRARGVGVHQIYLLTITADGTVYLSEKERP